MGGLGNVLFQLNYAWMLAEFGYKILICTKLIENKKIFKLFKWVNHDSYSVIKNIELLEKFTCQSGTWVDIIFLYLSKILKRKIFKHLNLKHEKIRLEEVRDGITVAGYFQSNVEIQKKFIEYTKIKFLKINSFEKNIDKNNVVLHYRGGDYFSNNLNIISYKGLGFIINNFNKVNVVTNDKKSFDRDVSKFFNNTKFEIRNGSVVNDFLYIMNHNIIISSNSTFCWWASELSEAEIIYEPNVYFKHIPNWNPLSIKKKNRIKYDNV